MLDAGLYKKINNLSIRHKLFVTFLSLIALPMGVFLFVNTFVASREGEKQALYTAKQALEQTKAFLESKTESAKNSLTFLTMNEKVLEIINRSPSEYSGNIGLWTIDQLDFDKIFFVVKTNPDINSIHIYMNEGPASVFESDRIIDLKKHLDSKWYRILKTEKRLIQWFAPDEFSGGETTDYIYAVQKITSGQNINQYIGAARIDIPKRNVEEILNKMVFTKSASAVILNSVNEVICSSSSFSEDHKNYFSEILRKIDHQKSGQAVWETVEHNTGKVLAGVESIDNSDWKLLLLIPYSDILSLNHKSRQQMVFILIIIAPLTLPLAYIVASSATKRIKKLREQMKNVENGDFNVPILLGNKDEIGELTRSFNYLLTKMSMLVDEKFELGKEIKNVELKALQAQINPHFLYNTLDLINWMSLKKNAPEIGVLVETLAKYYKLSLSSGKDMVTVQNELEHIEAYVQIQNMRFENHICLETSITDSVRSHLIPKLVFQPIIENAIIHGILETDEEAGHIRITSDMEENTLLILIEDDGIGMSPEKINTIFDEKPSSNHHGYGIRNIHERLRLAFGPEYGLSFKSALGHGTTVIIRIPA